MILDWIRFTARVKKTADSWLWPSAETAAADVSGVWKTGRDAEEHASPAPSHSASPPLFFRLLFLASCPALVSLSLGTSPWDSGGFSWFSLLSLPSWLLSDFLSWRSRLFSFSLRVEDVTAEEGAGFFPLLLRTFCCCCRTGQLF